MTPLKPCPGCGREGPHWIEESEAVACWTPDLGCGLEIRCPNAPEVWNSITIYGGRASIKEAIDGYLQELRDLENKVRAAVDEAIGSAIGSALAEASENNYQRPVPRWVEVSENG